MYLNQILLYTGLILTSATFAAAMQMLVPVFTLIIATIFQLESIQWKQRWGQAKILGILASVTGAVVMISYKGPPLLENRFTANLLPVPVEFLPAGLRSFMHSLSAVVGFQMDPWKLGAISLVGSSLCLASFINIQVPKFSLLLSAKGKKNTPR
jgi:drug/metabolite transporter (DMT)-like permease